MGARLVARIIDFAMFLLLIGALMVPLVVSFRHAAQPGSCTGSGGCGATFADGAFVYFMLMVSVLALVTALYEWLAIAFFGRTVGKWMVGIRVVRQDTGGKPGLLKGFLRFIVATATAQLCYVGYVSPFFDTSGRLQGWHDKAAGVLVVSIR
jgi:uncharacterized RDD family membrane protein YckC